MSIDKRLRDLEQNVFDDDPGYVDLTFADGSKATVTLDQIFGALDDDGNAIDLPLDRRGQRGEIRTIHARNGWRDGNVCSLFSAMMWKGCRYVD